MVCLTLNLSLWLNAYDVTIQVKLLQQQFRMLLFILYVVLTFVFVDTLL